MPILPTIMDSNILLDNIIQYFGDNYPCRTYQKPQRKVQQEPLSGRMRPPLMAHRASDHNGKHIYGTVWRNERLHLRIFSGF